MRINLRFIPAAALSLVGAAMLAACSDGAEPLLRAPETAARPLGAAQAYLLCTADVRAGTVSCRAASPGGMGGGLAAHYIYLESEHAVMLMNDYTATSTDISYDLQVVNLVPQPIGTDDGTTLHSRGVRVFFFSDPWVTDGTGSIWIEEPSTTGTFTASNQAYHQWNEIIQSQDTSVAEKHYRFGISGTVDAFSYWLGVSTNMQWAAITSASAATASVAVGDSVDLDAWRLNALGDTMSISSITWASDNTGVATVHSTSGMVTGVSAGTANVIASQSGSRSDTVVVTVN